MKRLAGYKDSERNGPFCRIWEVVILNEGKHWCDDTGQMIPRMGIFCALWIVDPLDGRRRFIAQVAVLKRNGGCTVNNEGDVSLVQN